jgi:hypothetical protein
MKRRYGFAALGLLVLTACASLFPVPTRAQPMSGTITNKTDEFTGRSALQLHGMVIPFNE